MWFLIRGVHLDTGSGLQKVSVHEPHALYLFSSKMEPCSSSALEKAGSRAPPVQAALEWSLKALQSRTPGTQCLSKDCRREGVSRLYGEYDFCQG